MQLRKWAGLVLLAGIAACGQDGPRWNADVEHEGTIVHFETWYHTPGLGERTFGGADGISYRISIDGKTVDKTGNYFPPEWEQAEGVGADTHTQEFWGQVAEKFKRIQPDKEHKKDHEWIYRVLIDLRDAPRTLAPSGNEHRAEQGLTAQPDDVPVHTDPNEKLTTEEEDEYSKRQGEKLAKHLRETHGGDAWSADSDPRNGKNRGYRHQIRESGYEFKQRLEIWAKSAWGTGFDHSGTKVWTFKRPIGSGEDAWVLIDGKPKRACNHGSCPETDGMKLRQVCDSGVVSDWYVIDGECEGNWMTSHLCNDDTSLQINHAQGIWTGNRCPGAKRGIVPKCGRQFK